jgi:hypothetical protein
LAALLVKVTASTPPGGDTWPVEISQAMRVVSTRVLPEPAPARIRAPWARAQARFWALSMHAAQQSSALTDRGWRLLRISARLHQPG